MTDVVAPRQATAMGRHYPALDLVRGIAALAVVGQHATVMAGYPRLLSHGYLAVDVFFVLSGFVIARAYEPRFADDLGIGRFMAIRCARLYPAILLGGLFGLLSVAVAVPGKWTVTPAGLLQFALVPFTTASTLAYPMNDVFWTLLLELGINLAHRLGWRRLTRTRLAVIVILAAAGLVLAAVRFDGLNVGFDRGSFAGGIPRVLYGYAAGLLCYRLLSAGRIAPPVVSVPILLVVLAVYLLVPAFGHPAAHDLLFIIVGAPLVLYIGLGARLPETIRPVALWLGTISYPLYAIHYPLLEIGRHIIGDDGGVATLVARWLPLTALIVAFAALVELVYDAPIRRRLATLLAVRRQQTAGVPLS